MKKTIILFLATFLVTGANAQGLNRSRFITDSLDNYVNRALTNWRIPGAAVCIVKNGRIVLMRGYGIKELGVPTKVDQNTLFMIGGNTNAFTATALAMLQQEHKLTIDERVTRYIPEFKLATPLLTQQVTIRDLLCHRVGFQNQQGEFVYWNSNLTRNEVIEKIGHLAPGYSFRTRWGYTDGDYVTAGEVIPRITGKTWEQYIKETIFAPLGMTNSALSNQDLAKSFNKASAHLLVDGRLIAVPYVQVDDMAPSAGIISSVQDLSKWVITLLANGKVGNKQVISAAAIEATFTPQIYISNGKRINGESWFNLDGLGWFVQNYAGEKLIMRDEQGGGFSSSIHLMPEENLGIIVLTNEGNNFLHEALPLEILDAILKKPFQDYSTKFLADYKSQNESDSEYFKQQKRNTQLRDSVALQLKPALNLNNYTGKYLNEPYGSLTITHGENNDLEMRFEHHQRMFVKLQPLGGNRFYAIFSNPHFGRAVFPFEVRNNKVTGVKINIPEVDPLTYDFKKQ